MTVPLSPAERRRLVNILGMMGSDHDGERAGAAALASRLVRDRGLTWDAVIPADGSTTTSSPSPGAADYAAWRAMLALCTWHRAALSEWEQGFVADLQCRRKPPTPKQVAAATQIADRLRARGLS